ncbi:hypothetical protein BAUCODRAFT_301738 [Baudoinia panamericana UAMH 10762]|uniref:Uncharacterized protein n=1 Tax=Baudoinia panamericana (strain UAMH 10762) TaxID=717646 RepID=M2M515_BAUPA|nr:uncharacterized protein BAUCODRAFT_301738 [Baudoinia panamericana UAMH 10762]EMC91706.1 hypothetical protein BAUCODRAFT_301738 [Baudoinia panamericana UAMH 10762]
MQSSCRLCYGSCCCCTFGQRGRVHHYGWSCDCRANAKLSDRYWMHRATATVWSGALSHLLVARQSWPSSQHCCNDIQLVVRILVAVGRHDIMSQQRISISLRCYWRASRLRHVWLTLGKGRTAMWHRRGEWRETQNNGNDSLRDCPSQ